MSGGSRQGQPAPQVEAALRRIRGRLERDIDSFLDAYPASRAGAGSTRLSEDIERILGTRLAARFSARLTDRDVQSAMAVVEPAITVLLGSRAADAVRNSCLEAVAAR